VLYPASAPASTETLNHVATSASGAIKLMACNVRFLAIPVIAGIRLIWQDSGQFSDIVAHSG
jgi:hypothetical protein